MLARGSHAGLKAMAQQEIGVGASAEAKAALAGGWWNLAEGQAEEPLKLKLRAHAAAWYQSALPGLSGPSRRVAEERIGRAPSIGRLSPRASGGEVRGRFVAVVKGEVQLYVNQQRVPISGIWSSEVAIKEGYVVVARVKSIWVYRAFLMAFLSSDRRLILPFRRAQFRVVNQADVAAIDAAAIGLARGQPKPGRPDAYRKEVWTGLKLPPEDSEWMFGPGKNPWYHLGCVIRRDMLKPIGVKPAAK